MPQYQGLSSRLVAVAVVVIGIFGVSAVGDSRIGLARGQQDADSITFTRDVAPILFTHCVGCHRPGGIGPFSLTTYAAVRDPSVADRHRHRPASDAALEAGTRSRSFPERATPVGRADRAVVAVGGERRGGRRRGRPSRAAPDRKRLATRTAGPGRAHVGAVPATRRRCRRLSQLRPSPGAGFAALGARPSSCDRAPAADA